jgi:hypothetical protein
MKKQICIMTKSLKDHDYCVAGIDLKSGAWIRLVSTEQGDAFDKNMLDDLGINVLDKNEVKGIGHSLELIEVKNLAFDTCLKGDGKNHHKVVFEYNNERYNLALTDPKLRIEGLDSWFMQRAIVVISIPPIPYGECELYYKFVAKVFTSC